MKIRKGFVSNSSSTSFLVAWDKKVEKLADVKKFIPNNEQAKILYKLMKGQEGVYLCVPPKSECKNCKKRFRCYTGGGVVEELAKLIATDGWDIPEDEIEVDEYDIELARDFIEENDGKVAYVFRIADFGEGAKTEAEASMRSGDVFEGRVPYRGWL